MVFTKIIFGVEYSTDVSHTKAITNCKKKELSNCLRIILPEMLLVRNYELFAKALLARAKNSRRAEKVFHR